eukprot:CAMPEP_0170204776 /NCGR_PEP_ID=MMETSP0116_2-20130129/1920_1 /TAXON_ID=400756 /ORGANISM="Durinskia baltica, Strain CSIRO CS-38" /LENGTH=142 /DNA_ID=CAMNT_0010455143 /DNA_START=235 /DNA_END=659 /DNA_ORIENTATION=+
MSPPGRHVKRMEALRLTFHSGHHWPTKQPWTSVAVTFATRQGPAVLHHCVMFSKTHKPKETLNVGPPFRCRMTVRIVCAKSDEPSSTESCPSNSPHVSPSRTIAEAASYTGCTGQISTKIAIATPFQAMATSSLHNSRFGIG